ncbi:MAG: hypothetical protein Q9M30_04755, partial [Mariprofundaceae bacterium]|nr:hypothetical protein [Mariprofundaceae bacterium]
SSWLQAQDKYMALEAEHLSKTAWSDASWPDRLRKLVVLAPGLIFFYCLIVKGGIMDGKAGLLYALQRTLAEIILSLKILENGMKAKVGNLNK